MAAGATVFAAALLTDILGAEVASVVLYILALAVAGGQVFFDAVKGILRRDLLDEKFLMSIAAIGAVIIGDYREGVAVMLFYLVGELFEHRAVRRSRLSIRSLMDIRPDEACVLDGGEERTVDAEDVAVGSTILVRPGARVPIDCMVLSGNADVDTSALTGESVPRAVGPSDTLDSGVIVLNGALTCKTLRIADESAAARVLDLVENANERKSREENFITAFSRIYTPAVVGCAVVLALLPSLLGLTAWRDSVYRALIFLIISCPCALVISVPMAFFGGIGCAASRGILYKGGNTFSALSRAKTFAFDKTGTLTTGALSVAQVHPQGMESGELLSLAASVEHGSHHPVADAIKKAASSIYNVAEMKEFGGKGVAGCVNGKRVFVGNERLMRECSAAGFVPETECAGAVYVAVDGAFCGSILLSDTVKPEAEAALSHLRALGASRTVMLSGDSEASARAVGDALGLDEVNAHLLPEEKYARLEELIAQKEGVVYVGDGINDAPSLARADVGVAMGGIGSDSAIEAADIVVVSDNLQKLPEAVHIARRTLRIAKENIVFALGVKFCMLAVSALGLVDSVGMWLAVFSDVGVAVLAILNSMRTLRYRVPAPQKRETEKN